MPAFRSLGPSRWDRVSGKGKPRRGAVCSPALASGLVHMYGVLDGGLGHIFVENMTELLEVHKQSRV